MRVFVADDEPRVRYALRVLLERQPEVEVVGEAANVQELMEGLEADEVDLLLLDWMLVRAHPQDLLDDMRRACPSLRVIVLSGQPEAKRIALEAGADAFVCKCDSARRVLEALEHCSGNGGAKDPMGHHDDHHVCHNIGWVDANHAASHRNRHGAKNGCQTAEQQDCP